MYLLTFNELIFSLKPYHHLFFNIIYLSCELSTSILHLATWGGNCSTPKLQAVNTKIFLLLFCFISELYSQLMIIRLYTKSCIYEPSNFVQFLWLRNIISHSILRTSMAWTFLFSYFPFFYLVSITASCRQFDKAAIITNYKRTNSKPPNSWRITTVHRVEELKSIIREKERAMTWYLINYCILFKH